MKRQSKRLTTRKRVKIEKKIRNHHAKLRQEQRKKDSALSRIPKNVLMTDEEKAHLEMIKKATEERNQNKIEVEVDEILSKFDECKDFDVFVEVVDFRDICGTRFEKYEKYVTKPLYFVVNFCHGLFDTDLDVLSNGTIVRDIKMFQNFKKICVFGGPRTGKFQLAKAIEQTNPEVEVRIIRIPVPETPSAVFRGAVNRDKVDGVFAFKEIFPYINQREFQDFYEIGNFHDYEACLDLLASKFSAQTKQRKKMEEGAMRVFKDLVEGQVPWIRRADGYEFIFRR